MALSSARQPAGDLQAACPVWMHPCVRICGHLFLTLHTHLVATCTRPCARNGDTQESDDPQQSAPAGRLFTSSSKQHAQSGPNPTPAIVATPLDFAYTPVGRLAAAHAGMLPFNAH